MRQTTASCSSFSRYPCRNLRRALTSCVSTTSRAESTGIPKPNSRSSSSRNRSSKSTRIPYLLRSAIRAPDQISSNLKLFHVSLRTKRRPISKRSTSLVNLSQLPLDILHTIVQHVMQPPRDGAHPVITPSCIRAALPLAQTCHTLYTAFQSTLHDIEVCHNSQFNDSHLRSLCRTAGSALHRLGVRKCSHLSARAFDIISVYCKSLRALDISNTLADDSAIFEITRASASHLVAFALNACYKISSDIFLKLPVLAPRLRFLDVGRLVTIDDTTIAYIAKGLTSLRTLIISHCHRITDKGLAAIGAYASLSSLTMRALPFVTDAGLSDLCRGTGRSLQILDVLECTGLTIGGYFATMQKFCPFIFRLLEQSECVSRLGERCLKDCIIATMPGLIYRISATDAVRRLPALYFLLLDESSLRPFRISVQGRSLNLSDFGTVLISNFGRKPTRDTRILLRSRFGYDSPMGENLSDESCQ